MRSKLLALITGLLLLLTIGVGTAAADPPNVQTVGQTAGNTQAAGAASGAAQVQPTNTNIDVRVLSPGNNGSVSQTNSASSQAAAGNANGTTQSAGQTQGGGGTQTAGQAAGNQQAAGALSNALQQAGLNGNAPVGALSPGSGGNTTQDNADTSSAAAGNANSTGQGATQSQAGGCGCEGSGSQTVGQAASNQQEAVAASEAKQIEPTNKNISVRVLSPGNDGDVTQSNTVDSSAKAGNLNGTGQSATQTQGGASGGGAGSQTTGQAASNEQAAGALSVGAQEGAKNVNLPIRVLSPGSGGDVTQTNSVDSSAVAGNANKTDQSATQTQGSGHGCECGGKGGSQTIGQAAENEQGALAGSAAIQKDAKNVNLPIRVLSPGSDGDVSQENAVSSSAKAGNLNGTRQGATQTQGSTSTPCGCGGKDTQVIGQAADSKQAALAGSLAIQKDAKNKNMPIRVLSPGSDGDVTQSNSVDSEAKAGNWNGTSQSATQGGGGAGGTGVQAIGQSNSNAQLAASLSAAAQLGAKNSNSPIRVLSPDDGHSSGSVSQENTVSSDAAAGNLNGTRQSATQTQGDAHPCGCKDGIGVQAIGQAASSKQAALSFSFGLQKDAKNANRPIDVLSPGRSGDVSQTNSVDSSSKAGNLNGTGQSASQTQGGSGGIGIQAAGQYAGNEQLAGALSAAAQLWASNKNAPSSVLSPSCGCGGKVGQSNEASSTGLAGNKNGTSQGATQTQAGRCLCATPVTKDVGPDSWGSTPMAVYPGGAIREDAAREQE
jgi:hypothetical protein